MKEYTIPIYDGIRLKHGSKVRVTVKSRKTVLQDDLHDADSASGAVTLACIVYNRAAMSGGVDWWNPATGRPIARPKLSIKARKTDILKDGEFCDCAGCQS